MLEALESMRTKEELCDYLKLKGIKDAEKTVENLKRMYNNKEVQSKVLSSKQLEQVAGGILCEFGDGFFSEPKFTTNGQDSFTLRMNGKEEVFSNENIDSLLHKTMRHQIVLEKFAQWAPNQLHNLPKTSQDKIFIQKFINNHLHKSKQFISKVKNNNKNIINNPEKPKSNELEPSEKIIMMVLAGIVMCGVTYGIASLFPKQK